MNIVAVLKNSPSVQLILQVMVNRSMVYGIIDRTISDHRHSIKFIHPLHELDKPIGIEIYTNRFFNTIVDDVPETEIKEGLYSLVILGDFNGSHEIANNLIDHFGGMKMNLGNKNHQAIFGFVDRYFITEMVQ